MQESTTVISRKGRVTIPAEIREALDLQEGDKIIWRVEKGAIYLRKAGVAPHSSLDGIPQSEPMRPSQEAPGDSEQAIIEKSVQEMFHNVNTRWPGL